MGLRRHILAGAIFCVLSSLVSAQEFRTVRDGIEYAEVTKTIDSQPVRMDLLRLDLTKVRIDIVHAMDAAIGTETVSSVAKRRGAIAAINAGFFRLDSSAFAGDPAGIFQIDGKLLSEANNGRIALLINNSAKRTEVDIQHLKTFGEFWSEARKLQISGIDRQIKENEDVLYTPEFGPATPPSEAPVLEITIDNKRVQTIAETNGKTAIPKTGYVLTVAGAKRQEVPSVAVKGKEG